MDVLSWRNIYLMLLCFTFLQEYLTQDNNDASPHTAIATTDNSSCARIPNVEADESLLEDAKYCDYPKLWSMENNTCLFFKDVECGYRQEPITPCEYFNSNCSKPHGENVSLCTCQPHSDLNYETCLNMSDGDHIWPARRWTQFYIHCNDRRTIPRECSDSKMFNFIDGHCDAKVEFVNQAYNLSLSSDIPETFRYLIQPHSTVSDIQQTDMVEVTPTPVSTEPKEHWLRSTMLSDSLNFVKQSEQTFHGDSKQSNTFSSTKSSNFRNTLEKYLTPMLDASSDVFQSEMESVAFTEYSLQQSLLETLILDKVKKYIYRDDVTTVSKKSIAAHGIKAPHVETLLLSAPSKTNTLSSLSRFNQLNTLSLPKVRTHSPLLLNSSYLRLISPSSASMYHSSSPSKTYSYQSITSSSSIYLTLPVALSSTKNITSMVKETVLSPAFKHSTPLDSFNFTSSSEARSAFSSPFSSLILSSPLHSKFASNDFELSTLMSNTASSFWYPTASTALSSSFTEVLSPDSSSELNLLTSSLLPVYSLPLHSKSSATQFLKSLLSKGGKYNAPFTSPSLNSITPAAIVASSDWLVSTLSASPVSNLIDASDSLSSESHWTNSSTDLIGFTSDSASKSISLSSIPSFILEATAQAEASNNLLYTKSTIHSYLRSDKSSRTLMSYDNQINWSSGEPQKLISLLSSLSSLSSSSPSALPLATTSSILSQESVTILSSSFIKNPPLSPTLPSVSEPSKSSTQASLPILSSYSASLKPSRSLLPSMPAMLIQPDSTTKLSSIIVPVSDLTVVSSKVLMSSYLFSNTTPSVSLSSLSAFQLPKTSISPQTQPSTVIYPPPLSTLSSAKVSSKLSSSATLSLSPILPSKEILPSISTTLSSSTILTLSSPAMSLSQISSILSLSATFSSSSTTTTLSSSAILSSMSSSLSSSTLFPSSSTTTKLSSSAILSSSSPKPPSLSTSATIFLSSSSKLSSSQILSSSLSTALSASPISSSSSLQILSSSSTPTQSSSNTPNSFLSLTGIATHPSIGTSKLSSIKPSPTISSMSSFKHSETSTALISYSSEIVSSSLSAGEFEKISGEKTDSKTSLIVGISVGVTAALLCVIITVIIVLRNRSKRNTMSGVRLPPELYISENL